MLLQDYHGGDNQRLVYEVKQFEKRSAKTGDIRDDIYWGVLRFMHSAKVLGVGLHDDIMREPGSNGSPVVQVDETGGDDELWRFQELVPDGEFAIRNKGTGRVLMACEGCPKLWDYMPYGSGRSCDGSQIFIWRKAEKFISPSGLKLACKVDW